MDRLDAELQAFREAYERNSAKRKAEILGDPIELFQALQPVGMTITTTDELNIYELLGDITKQGLDIKPNANISKYTAAQMMNTVIELSNLIESAVEDYIEEYNGE